MSEPELQTKAPPQATPVKGRATLMGHLAICRMDHWFKNVFVLPGIVAAIGMRPHATSAGGCSCGIVVGHDLGVPGGVQQLRHQRGAGRALRSSPTRSSTTARFRRARSASRSPTCSGSLLMVVGVGSGYACRAPFAITVGRAVGHGLHLQHPARSAARTCPYVDVLSESINNPLRMLAGWFIASTAVDRARLAAAQLLDGRLLLHGHQALRRVPRNRRPGARRRLPQVVRLLHRAAAAGLDHVLWLGGDAVPGRVHHALPAGADPRLPAGGAGDGDLLCAVVQEGQRRAASGGALQGADADGGGRRLRRVLAAC